MQARRAAAQVAMMAARRIRPSIRAGNAFRSFGATAKANAKVCVIGAAGGIGQPMSLLLKLSGKCSHLSLYDMVNTPGVAADLSHCNTRGKVTGHKGPAELPAALVGCDVVVVPAGVPRKPGMTRDDLFNTNANINKGLAEACAEHCPTAAFLIISNPVNSTVPIWAATLQKAGMYNPRKLMGVTTLDVCRAKTFVADNQGKDPEDVEVDVVGGHAGETIMPLLSQVKGATFTDDAIKALSHRIQFGGDEVVKAKDGAGSATLSMAHAGAYFALKVVDALGGAPGIRECTFIDTTLAPTDAPFKAAPFFASPVILGKGGVETVMGIGELSAFEQAIFDANMPVLKQQAEKGFSFIKNAA